MSIISLLNNLDIRKKGERAKGKVVGVEPKEYDKEKYKGILKPTIEFSTATGETVLYTPRINSKLYRYNMGDEVDILYIKGNTARVTIDNSKYMYKIHLDLIATGVLYLAGALIILVT